MGTMDIEFVTALLSGTSSYSSPLSRVTLSCAFVMRLTALLTESKVFKKEQDFACNSTQRGCQTVCFNTLSPYSAVNLFALQLLFIFSYALAVAVHFRESTLEKSATWFRGPLKTKYGKFRFHILSLFAKCLIEGIFLVTFYQLSDTLLNSGTMNCNLYPCEQLVMCAVLNVTEQVLFSYFMYGLSLACALICIVEIHFAFKDFQNQTFHDYPVQRNP
ncbi:gap junction beta-2 protein-like [Protopterus annectens]|uniref:gap junction beta-2 protein-like n=1 Tax=Protopterus annectens TaxID=7888 RepID=UPI001CFB3FE8|nr:gap junction beta-2 protein-like [Protopterus annectens]